MNLDDEYDAWSKTADFRFGLLNAAMCDSLERFGLAMQEAAEAMRALARAVEKAELEEIAPGLSNDYSDREFAAFMDKLL